ncbi:hypothetical protein GGI43DRAFT_238716 [Trichoderma evansii]
MISSMTFASLAASSSASISTADHPTPLSSISRDEPPLKPPQYCHRVIHVPSRERILDHRQDYRPPNVFSLNSWEPWPFVAKMDRPLTKLMQDSLTLGNITSVPPASLPISSLISGSLPGFPRSQEPGESLKFAIISGNLELIEWIIDSTQWSPGLYDYFREIHPCHLAASYLDGGNTCCSLLAIFMEYLSHPSGDFCEHLPCNLNFSYEDSMGHTIFDCLIISVLRSHTNVAPVDVSSGFANTKRYPGEEKDICGRWDADSPIIRQLFQQGYYRIPFDWKHPFCHSSAQAVCHNLMVIFHPGNFDPYINHPSGLFIRQCSKCGAKLTLGTLHLVVLLAYHLATSRIQGETLFGAVAVLICLLRLGANVSYKTEVSIHEILGDSSPDTCRHEYMEAGEFMRTIPSDAIGLWSPECKIAWDCMRSILRLAKNGKFHGINNSATQSSAIRHCCRCGNQPTKSLHRKRIFGGEESSSTEPECSECLLKKDFYRWRFPCGNPQLDLIWALIQAEMRTHRRILDVNPWVSGDFSMVGLKQWLEGESEKLRMPLVNKEMLRGVACTSCGVFDNGNKYISFSIMECFIMNLDIYHQT